MSLLLLDFSFISTVASIFLHLYSTDDKNIYIKDEKFLHSERFTDLHGEEKKEAGDRGDQEEKKGNQKRREQASQ